MIEEHEHTDTTLDSYYPSKASTVYSVLSDFDKYGRLTKTDGVVENVYDVFPTYDDNGDLIAQSANGSAVLATSKDVTNSQLSKYHYNERGQLSAIETKSSSGSLIKVDGYEYDNANRLTQDTCIWDWSAGKVVASQITYVKEDTDPSADGKINDFTYMISETSDTSVALSVKTTNSYDDPHGRLTKKSYLIGNKTFTKTIEYDKTRVKTVTDSIGGAIEYQYDAMGRITKAGNMEYTYDAYGQLTEEKDVYLDKTIQYVYNGIGNISSVKTISSSGSTSTKNFTYGDTANPDRLTKFGSYSITYNTMGCPTSYNGKNFFWSDGKLSSMSNSLGRAILSNQENYFYTYNAKGQRTHKNYSYLPVDLSATYYYTKSINAGYTYDNTGRLIKERRTYTYGDNTTYSIEFMYLYDESGIVGVQFKDGDEAAKAYYYQKNLQGDIVAIYDTAGAVQAKYSYDAFGNCTVTDSTNSHLAAYNPIRYRGYYLDSETGWYFLNARYYSPEWRRFISPDDTAYLDPENVNGLNLYCYCGNDPIDFVDPSGREPMSTITAMILFYGILLVLLGGTAIYLELTYGSRDTEKKKPVKISQTEFNASDDIVIGITQGFMQWSFNMFGGTGAGNIAARMFDTEDWLDLDWQ